MALKFNTIALQSSLLGFLNLYGSGSTMSLKIYPSSVALPTLPPAYNSAPAGYLVNFTTFTLARVGSQIKLTVLPAATAAVATGTPAWFFLVNGTASTSGVMIGDNIGVSGSAPIVTLSSMSLVSGTNVSLSDFTLTLLG